jgi:hypothetical protein
MNGEHWDTDLWYGYCYFEEDSIIAEQFFPWVDTLRSHCRDEFELLFKDNSLVDLMYDLVSDDNYCNKDLTHQIYMLALGCELSKRKILLFSSAERKYLYLDKIIQISRSVIFEIQGKIAKKPLLYIGACAGCLRWLINVGKILHSFIKHLLYAKQR